MSASFNGGAFITAGTCVYSIPLDPLGSGPIDVSGNSCLVFGGTSPNTARTGASGQVTNAIALHGHANGAYTALFLDWNASDVEFTGQITLNNSDSTYGNPATFSSVANQHFGSTMTISGPITGTGGVMFGNPYEAPNGGVTLSQITISGIVANTFTDDTYVTGQFLILAKDSTSGAGTNTAAAIPGNLHLAPSVNGAANAIGSVGLLADNQTSANTVVHFDSPSWPAAGMWAEFSLGGRTDTVRGLTTAVSDGLNAVCNSSYSASVCPKNVYPVPTSTGTLTIMTQSGDDFTYAGVIKDDLVSTVGVPALALVKDGPGTQRFVINTSLGAPTGWGAAAMFTYTGGTTVKAGTLDTSAVGQFTPGSPITLEGGTLLAGNLLSGPITRGATTSGTLEAGGTTFTSLTLTGAVDIGAATVDGGQTLVIAPTVPAVPDVIDSVTGTGTVQVAGGATLNSTRITVDTLIVGGTAIVTPMTSAAGVTSMPSLATVPEPSTLVLLVLAGMGRASGLASEVELARIRSPLRPNFRLVPGEGSRNPPPLSKREGVVSLIGSQRGIDLSIRRPELAAAAGGGTVGRPKLARFRGGFDGHFFLGGAADGKRRRAVGVQQAEMNQGARQGLRDVRFFAVLAVDVLDEPHDMVRFVTGKSHVQFLDVERDVGMTQFIHGLPARLDVLQGALQVFFLFGQPSVSLQPIGFAVETRPAEQLFAENPHRPAIPVARAHVKGPLQVFVGKLIGHEPRQTCQRHTANGNFLRVDRP